MKFIPLILILSFAGFHNILCAQPDSLNALTVVMQKKLNLTEDQLIRVDSINVKYAEQRNQIRQLSGRREKFRQLKVLAKARDHEMQVILTAEQFQNYRMLKADLKEKFKETYQTGKNQTTPENSNSRTENAANYVRFTTRDGRERQYRLYLPESHPDSLPLVIVLHGTYGTGERMQKALGFDEYAGQYGFMVAYPNAYTPPEARQTARWNDGRETLESSQQGIDDVAFILEMIEHINANTPVDRRRIYVTGASNGGIMTYRLGCAAAKTFAAIAPVIGNIADNERSDATSFFNTCNPEAPVSVLAINGDADPFIPIDGGKVCQNIPKQFCEGGFVVSQEKSLAKFFSMNDCSGEFTATFLPVQFEDSTRVEKRDYLCNSNSEIIAYIIHGGGHAWPPLTPQLDSRSGKSTKNLDATKIIVEFFMQHVK